jgi:hypothetical protein
MTDEVAKAVAAMKRLAAGRILRKGEIEAELAKRRKDRQSLEGLASPEAESLRGDLDKRIEALAHELATVDVEIGAARAEIASLERLDAAAPAAVDSTLDEDPALANVRAHIRELEIEAGLGDPPRSTVTKDEEPTVPGRPPKKTI